jgi:hypothetical protein
MALKNCADNCIGPPHRRCRIPIHQQDPRPQRRRGLDCPQEDSGDPPRERRARGTECYPQHWRQACYQVNLVIAKGYDLETDMMYL